MTSLPSYGTSNPATPQNVPPRPVDEQLPDAGLNLLEVPGDHLPEPVGVPERLRLDAVDRLLGLFHEGV